MNNSIQIIPLAHLSLALVPALAVVVIMYKWSHDGRNTLYALVRMLVQLSLIGYILAYIFKAQDSLVVLAVLVVMVLASSWISLRTVPGHRKVLFLKAFGSIVFGGGTVLVLITQGVLRLEPWFQPSYFIPIAGMIFANAMNSVSLAADRLVAEVGGEDYAKARNAAFRASLIPIVNSLFAVGLVSLPGMMTGQILSGVSPLIAARYQIMVMCMVFGAAGISSACFLVLAESQFANRRGEETEQ